MRILLLLPIIISAMAFEATHSFAQQIIPKKKPPMSSIETKKRPSPRPSTDTRITALETKTNYYQKSTKTITGTYGTTARTLPSTATADVSLTQNSATCDGIDIEQDPLIVGYGTLYAWLSIDLTYTGITPDPNSEEYSIVWGAKKDDMNTQNSCFEPFNVENSSGAVTLKAFCSFDVRPGTIIKFHFVGASACTTDTAIGYNLTMKSNLLEMIEPPN